MTAPQTATVDVRDMLCAQALAVVAQALDRAPVDEGVSVSYNAEDVHRDLLAWAAEQGCLIHEEGPVVLHIRRDDGASEWPIR